MSRLLFASLLFQTGLPPKSTWSCLVHSRLRACSIKASQERGRAVVSFYIIVPVGDADCDDSHDSSVDLSQNATACGDVVRIAADFENQQSDSGSMLMSGTATGLIDPTASVGESSFLDSMVESELSSGQDKCVRLDISRLHHQHAISAVSFRARMASLTLATTLSGCRCHPNDPQANCGANADCINIPSGHECVCLDGFHKEEVEGALSPSQLSPSHNQPAVSAWPCVEPGLWCWQAGLAGSVRRTTQRPQAG